MRRLQCVLCEKQCSKQATRYMAATYRLPVNFMPYGCQLPEHEQTQEMEAVSLRPAACAGMLAATAGHRRSFCVMRNKHNNHHLETQVAHHSICQ